MDQACPLCRKSLPPGPFNLFEDAVRRYTIVQQMVERGHASWSDLSTSAQRELDLAIAGWRAAAEGGLPPAQCFLGQLYQSGQGVVQSDVEAARWIKKSAEQGFAEAQYDLGKILEFGCGMEKNVTDAAQWYLKAAEQGFLEAQYQLGAIFESGCGVEKNDDEAAHWTKIAAGKGHATAQYNTILDFYSQAAAAWCRI